MGALSDIFGGGSQGLDHSTVLASLLAGMNLNGDMPCDILVSFCGSPQRQLSGFLVTEKDDPQSLVAYCPMPVLATGCKAWRTELVRQFNIALRLAQYPHEAETAVDAIWLGGDEERPIPLWIFGLSCIPLKDDWDGELVHPRPFCPSLFAKMAEQPRAVAWIKKRQLARARERGVY